MSRPRRRRSPDVGEVVLVAAAVSGIDPADVVTACELSVLVGATGRARLASSVTAAAAELLVAVAAGRPFPAHNAAIAWGLAAHVVALDGRRLELDPASAVALVTGAADGSVDEATVAAAFTGACRRRPGRWRRILTWLGDPTHVAPLVRDWSCPLCGAPVTAAAGRSTVFLAAPSAQDLVVDCSRRRRVHDAAGVRLAGAGAPGRHGFERRLAVLQAERRIAASAPRPV